MGEHGYVNYALFIDTMLVGTIEAKAEHPDIPFVIDYQSRDCSRHIRREDALYGHPGACISDPIESACER